MNYSSDRSLQFICSNQNNAMHFCHELDIKSWPIYFSPFNVKAERWKHPTLLLLRSREEAQSWTDYWNKLSAEKRNIFLRFILPILYVDDLVAEQESSLLTISSQMSENTKLMIKELLVQKLQYLESNIQTGLDSTRKFLQGLLSKIDWKGQVVLSSKEMSSFLDLGDEMSKALGFSESMSLYDLYHEGLSPDILYFDIEGYLYSLPKIEIVENQLRKIIYFSIYYQSYLEQKDAKASLKQESMLFESIFQMAPFPIAIENSGRGLIWQNQTFANLKLLPRAIKQMHTNENLQTKHGFFIVFKQKFSIKDYQYELIYLGQQSEKLSNSNEDLGIITSSLAHEMNNPLAAIKAAVEVITMLCDSKEKLITLDQMHVTVQRCLQLVKIFLGFTKASHLLSHSSEGEKMPLRDCWDYAMQLMRTRLVSSSARLHTEWCVQQEYTVGNSNILTMLLYWVFSQIINVLERQKLVSTNMAQDEKLYIEESKNSIALKMNMNMKNIADLMQQSLLVRHLLDLEGLKWKINGTQELILVKDG